MAATENAMAGLTWLRLAAVRAGGCTWLSRFFAISGGLAAVSQQAQAADLPEDRAEVLYHSYVGGGVNASGPALLVQKSVGDAVSISGSYYVDTVSNASIDVVTTASPFHEQRTETGAGLNYARDDASLALEASRSREPDYDADSVGVDVTQDVFGGMTSIKLGYTRGWDSVRKRADPNFSRPADHWMYRLGITQVLTPRWLATLNLEADSDAGYLGSPYRVARVFGAAVPEVDPPTRTSRAVLVQAVGNVTQDAAVRASLRYFTDTWAIRAETFELGYAQHAGSRWLVDGGLRYYVQGQAVFYSDNFASPMTYMSRNRQLSRFHDMALTLKASYLAYRRPGVIDLQLSASVQRVEYRYGDFTDLRNGQAYRSGATVSEIFATASF